MNPRSFFRNVLLSLLILFAFQTAFGIHYVSRSGTHEAPYTNWYTAATTLQAAIDVCAASEFVLVTNGTYDTGGRTAAGYGLTNRVVITNAITVTSVNGPEYTTILGAADPGTSELGPGAVRCVYMTNDARLVGFRLTGGYTASSSPAWMESGGGAFLDVGGTLSNCIIEGNAANTDGGGIYFRLGGQADRCVVRSNSTYDSSARGGGVYFSGNGGSMRSSLIAGNTTDDRGGGGYCAAGGRLLNCTVADNEATGKSGSGGGLWFDNGGTLTNCIVYHNTADSNPNWGGLTFNYLGYCCTVPTNAYTKNSFTNDPKFADRAGGNYRLATNSPCMDAGINKAWMTGALDLDGHPRIVHGTVDVGAYETLLSGWDEDADNLPDWYEWEYAGSLTAMLPDADDDEDGADNEAEAIAGTDPTDDASVFAVASSSAGPAAGEYIVRWSSASGRLYDLERGTNLLIGTFTVLETNIVATPPENSCTDAPPAALDIWLYRVKTWRAP